LERKPDLAVLGIAWTEEHAREAPIIKRKIPEVITSTSI
jgi:hypothetical protein